MQNDCGERDLHEIEQAEWIRRSAAERQDQCETECVGREQCSNKMLCAFSQSLLVRGKQPIAGNLTSDNGADEQQRQVNLQAKPKRGYERSLSGY
jgi:hypothetical protein